jgi:hypothetical protein
MPNWTTNTVTFTGPTDQLVAMKVLLAGEGDDDQQIFDFNRIVSDAAGARSRDQPAQAR